MTHACHLLTMPCARSVFVRRVVATLLLWLSVYRHPTNLTTPFKIRILRANVTTRFPSTCLSHFCNTLGRLCFKHPAVRFIGVSRSYASRGNRFRVAYGIGFAYCLSLCTTPQGSIRCTDFRMSPESENLLTLMSIRRLRSGPASAMLLSSLTGGFVT